MGEREHANDPERQRIEADFLERLQEEMRRMTVEDHILHLVRSLPSMAFQFMGIYQAEGARDLRQSRLAIDAFRALLDVLAPLRTPEEIAMYRSTLAQMQMAYVTAAEQEERVAEGAQAGRAPGADWSESDEVAEEALYDEGAAAGEGTAEAEGAGADKGAAEAEGTETQAEVREAQGEAVDADDESGTPGPDRASEASEEE